MKYMFMARLRHDQAKRPRGGQELSQWARSQSSTSCACWSGGKTG
jgi:hypothetical protein